MTKKEDRGTALGIANSATSLGMSAGPYVCEIYVIYRNQSDYNY